MLGQERARAIWSSAMMVGCLALPACGDSSGPKEELSNQTDSFSLQYTDFTNYANDRTYTWRNSGTRGTVTQSSQITAGAAMLRIIDGAGVEVYSANLSQNGSLQTAVGATGDWRIDIDIETPLAGTITFRVQRGG